MLENSYVIQCDSENDSPRMWKKVRAITLSVVSSETDSLHQNVSGFGLGCHRSEAHVSSTKTFLKPYIKLSVIID